METVFDHNITDGERRHVMASRFNDPKDEYLKFITPRSAYDHIAALYYHRGDDDKGDWYAAKRDAEIWFVDWCE